MNFRFRGNLFDGIILAGIISVFLVKMFLKIDHDHIDNSISLYPTDKPLKFSKDMYQVCVVVRYTVKHQRSVLGMVSSLFAASGVNSRIKLTMVRTDETSEDISLAKTIIEGILVGNPSLSESPHFSLTISNITSLGKEFKEYRRSLNYPEDRYDWGYVVTDLAVDEVANSGECEYIMFTNSDNLYHPSLMSSTALARYYGVTMIGFHMVSHYEQPEIGVNRLLKSRFKARYIDLGAVLWNSKVLRSKKNRFLKPHYLPADIFAADGYLVEAVLKQEGTTTFMIPEVLFLHI